VAATPTTHPTASRSAPLPRSGPLRLRIPAIRVDAPLVPLGLQPDGSMQVPADFAVAGWYVHAPTPGELGPAVLAGHVDSRAGPAVFYRLATLRPGDRVTVSRQDGRVAAFTVDRIARYPKARFPTTEVYGDLPYPGLRLITCGGSFDPGAGHYRDNVVVFASLGQPR
jgi:sortase (surface protein transpeptidase)